MADARLLRRLLLTLSVWLSGAALSLSLAHADVVEAPWSFQVLLLVVLIDAYTLHGFLARRGAKS
jgi:hypothetical protein